MSMSNSNEEDIAKALRDLVEVMYKDCHGAYGTDFYEGCYEEEIKQLAKVLSITKKDSICLYKG